MNLEETSIQAMFDKDEFTTFREIVVELCSKYESIQGALMLGSLVQRLQLPLPTVGSERGSYERAYNLIRNKGRRRPFPTVESDLDIWICTSDPDNANEIKAKLNERAINLISWLAENHDMHHSHEWINLKQDSFGEYYKHKFLYDDAWQRVCNSAPWEAKVLVDELVVKVERYLPNVSTRINHYFSKKLRTGFFEVRAYPSCTFNLRPEEITLGGSEDKTPFPRIMDEEWLSESHNCFVLYVKPGEENRLIYPFNLHGERLGQQIANFIKEI